MTLERFSWLDRHMLIPYHTPCRRAMDKRTGKNKAVRIALLVMHAAGECELAYTYYVYTAYICPGSQSFDRNTLPYGFVSRYIDSKAVCSVQSVTRSPKGDGLAYCSPF